MPPGVKPHGRRSGSTEGMRVAQRALTQAQACLPEGMYVCNVTALAVTRNGERGMLAVDIWQLCLTGACLPGVSGPVHLSLYFGLCLVSACQKFWSSVYALSCLLC